MRCCGPSWRRPAERFSARNPAADPGSGTSGSSFFRCQRFASIPDAYTHPKDGSSDRSGGRPRQIFPLRPANPGSRPGGRPRRLQCPRCGDEIPPAGRPLRPFSADAEGFVKAVGTVQITGLENTHPAWSPDGSSVAQLTDNDAADSTPTFTPDGRHIVWASELDGNLDGRLICFNSTRQPRPVTMPQAWQPPFSAAARAPMAGVPDRQNCCRHTR